MRNIFKFISKDKGEIAKIGDFPQKPPAQNEFMYDPDDAEDDDDDEDEHEDNNEEPVSPTFPNVARLRHARHSVSAEVYGEWNKKQYFTAPVYEKTPEQEQRIRSILMNSFMFQTLEADDLKTILLAFTEVRLKKDDALIRQGDDGDSLYLIEKGTVDVFKTLPGEIEPKHICVMSFGDTVGELALLYNTPRAATVIAKEDVVLWKLGQESFNHIVRGAAMRKRDLYEKFLKEVDILKDMDSYERSKLSDALRETIFGPRQTIITQGEMGDTFYIIESGHAVALKDGIECFQYHRGDYFGELALIRNQPRAATVKTLDEPVKCVHLDRKSFCRLLGPIEGILKRNAARYEQFQHNLNLGSVQK